MVTAGPLVFVSISSMHEPAAGAAIIFFEETRFFASLSGCMQAHKPCLSYWIAM